MRSIFDCEKEVACSYCAVPAGMACKRVWGQVGVISNFPHVDRWNRWRDLHPGMFDYKERESDEDWSFVDLAKR